MQEIDEAVIDWWRILLEDQSADTEWMERHDVRDRHRVQVRREILELLDRFLSGSIVSKELRATFDKKARNEWNVFGFRGLSGAMFLSKLVKHIPDEQALAANLRRVLPAPTDEREGRERMTSFMQYLLDLIKSGVTTKQLIQPARVPFLVSAWWHLQETERWPIFYETVRRSFARDGVTKSCKDPIEEYFDFRTCFMTLSEALGLTSWAFEHLCAWYAKRRSGKPVGWRRSTNPATPREKATTPVDHGKGEDSAPPANRLAGGTPHTHIQWLLATIGRTLGCRIWIAKNDHGKEWNGKPLRLLSLKHLPNLGMGTGSQKVIELIDVLWLKGGNQVVAAFEVEHSTSVYSGLLRMSDLTVLSPNLFFPLYIVAPEERLAKVQRELSRPTFQTLELHKRCGYFSYERLFEQADNIKQWANDPSAIDKLASRIDDTDSDGVD